MSGWIECPTPGCPGDMRYAAPGRGHIPGCTAPVPASDAHTEPHDPPRDAIERTVEAIISRRARVESRSVTFEVGEGWPTPNNCLRIADALDAMSPARYGDILRAYAHAEDARFDAHGPLAPSAPATESGQA